MKTTIKSKFENCFKRSCLNKGTNYYKVFILGNTGIYYANPNYGHADYNKFRVCDITPYTKKLMIQYNKKLQLIDDALNYYNSLDKQLQYNNN